MKAKLKCKSFWPYSTVVEYFTVFYMYPMVTLFKPVCPVQVLRCGCPGTCSSISTSTTSHPASSWSSHGSASSFLPRLVLPHSSRDWCFLIPPEVSASSFLPRLVLPHSSRYWCFLLPPEVSASSFLPREVLPNSSRG